MYINYTTDNPQEKLLTIGKFKGEKTEEWDFRQASQIIVEAELEEGNITIALYDISENLIFEEEVKSAKKYQETFDGEFSSGKYKFRLHSKEARDVEINVEFKD